MRCLQVEEAQIQCTDEHRDELLYYLVARHPGRTLVFANAISTVRRLAAVMGHLKVPCGALHAGMQQRQRLTALDRLRSNPDAVMIATDVAARGIDVQVSMLAVSATGMQRYRLFGCMLLSSGDAAVLPPDLPGSADLQVMKHFLGSCCCLLPSAAYCANLCVCSHFSTAFSTFGSGRAALPNARQS